MRQETNYGGRPQERIIRPNEGLILPQSALEREEGIRSLIELIDKEREEKKGAPVFVMVAGRSHAGKSLIITDEIVKRYGVEEVSVISMDNYFKGRSFIFEMEAKGIEINRDHPRYMDFDLLKVHLSDLAKGKPINMPKFNKEIGERDGSETVFPKSIIIVEGIFALRDEMDGFGDVKAFVDVSLTGSILRSLLHNVGRLTPDRAKILEYYLKTVEPMYQENIKNTSEKADVVIKNEFNPMEERADSFDMEVKFKNMISIREILREKKGATFSGKVRQEDFYMTPRDRNIAGSDELMRTREENDRIYFTHKGPRMGEGIKARSKLEFEIDKIVADLIFDTYADIGIEIIKDREIYTYGGVTVNIDNPVVKIRKGERTFLGEFVELKTKDGLHGEEKIKMVCESLGISYDQRITDSYIDM